MTLKYSTRSFATRVQNCGYSSVRMQDPQISISHRKCKKHYRAFIPLKFYLQWKRNLFCLSPWIRCHIKWKKQVCTDIYVREAMTMSSKA